MIRYASLPLALAVLWGTASSAHAEGWLYGGEVRLSAFSQVGSQGLFGNPGGNSQCGAAPPGDGGLWGQASGVLLRRTQRYRYQLGLTGGYYGAICTDSMRRPVGGLDFSGFHKLTERTGFTFSLRGTYDQFDRNVELRTRGVNLADPMAPPKMDQKTGDAPGTPFLLLGGSLEAEHRFAGRHGVRLGISADAMVIVAERAHFSELSTLGPMEAGEVSAAWFHDNTVRRFEIPLRYRVSHYYSSTLQDVLSWQDVPPAQDGSLRFAYERRFSRLLTLHLDAGAGLSYQPHLCQRFGRGEVSEGCSIDRLAPTIRAATAPPPLEAVFADLFTVTPVGEVSLRYEGRKRIYEVALTRGYEPNPYASTLDLVDRLKANVQVQLSQDINLLASAMVGHHAHSTAGRLTLPSVSELQVVSPQNRSLYMAQGGVLLDYRVASALALFFQADFQVFSIRGERVLAKDKMGKLQDGCISGFPEGPDTRCDLRMPMPGEPTGPTEEGLRQDSWRIWLTLGVRLFANPSSRDEVFLRSP